MANNGVTQVDPVAAEIGLAFGLSHHWHPLAIVLGIGGLGQAAFHVYAAVKNFELS